MTKELYTGGGYLLNNPDWHEEDSLWKAGYIFKMIEANNLSPKSVVEVGCGAGGVISELQKKIGEGCDFFGYDISAKAIELAKPKANDHLSFKHMDVCEEKALECDLALLIDVFEHVEDCFGFLRAIADISLYKIFHIPLDLSAQTVVRAGRLVAQRESVGHIHYFTKDTALSLLKDTGYEVLDFFYTPFAAELPAKSVKSFLARLPRKILFSLSKDFAVRLLGGYSLMVLARRAPAE